MRLTTTATCSLTTCNMDTLQLSHALLNNPHTRKTFLDVFPSDQLPVKRVTQRPASLVVNTHPHHLPGEHWLAIYLPDHNTREFFDSYGNPPFSSLFPKTIMEFLNKNSNEVLFHSKRLQGPTSTTCGHHCLFFLHHRCRGAPFDDVVKMYTPKPEQNDRMVLSFVKNTLKNSRTSQNMYRHAQTCVSCVP